MASFVIHHIAGVNFLSILENRYGITLTEREKNEFLLGNLIVDSSKIREDYLEYATIEELKELKKKYRILIQEEKIATHFRNRCDLELCIQVPVLSNFTNKYQSIFCENLSVLGYFYHLFTDKMFFDDLFTETFECLDSEGKKTMYAKEAKKIKVYKNGKIYSDEDFWDGESRESIYYDYTIMNKILLEYYCTTFDENSLLESARTFINPGIEEVDYNNITGVINKTSQFIQESCDEEDGKLNIFDEELVKNFINFVSNQFILEYADLIELSCLHHVGKEKKK